MTSAPGARRGRCDELNGQASHHSVLEVPVAGQVAAAISIGLMLCVVAVVIGPRMALHATVVPCPDGHKFPAGTTNFPCFAHKHAGDGTTIVIFAIVLGTVLALAGLIAQLQLRRQGPS